MERLEALPRTGWLVSGVDRPESIAAHCYMVALTALYLADQIDQPVDTERLLRIALLHDAGEAILTDLPAPVKRFIELDAIHDAERRAAALIFEHAPPSWLEAVHAYHEADSIEARLVKAADRIQMLAKALQYETQRRGDVRRFFEATSREDFGFPLVAAIFERLDAMRREGSWWEAGLD